MAELRFLQAYSPGTAMAVLIGLAVAVTLVPALPAIDGRAVSGRTAGRRALRRRRGREDPDGARTRAAPLRALILATDRPRLTAALVMAALVYPLAASYNSSWATP
ncbi:MAG: MMPL family transporter [Thermoleophilaceae bacterium]|nr:MMPL family transporter [Thermoleophilaceae bacterium]